MLDSINNQCKLRKKKKKQGRGLGSRKGVLNV